MGNTVTAVMLHLASWQKKLAKENHSPAEIVQTGFPHMENTRTHLTSWQLGVKQNESTVSLLNYCFQ